jgi:hypothetical protein
MENKTEPHKHPFLESDKWSKIDKELNDADKDYLVEDKLADLFEKFELTEEHKQWVHDGVNYKKVDSGEGIFIIKNKDF